MACLFWICGHFHNDLFPEGILFLERWVWQSRFTNRVWLKKTNSAKQTLCSCAINGWNYFQLGPDLSTAPLQHGLWAGWGQGRRCLKDCRCHSCLESKQAMAPCTLHKTAWPRASLCLACWARAKDLFSSPQGHPCGVSRAFAPCSPAHTQLAPPHPLLPVAVNHVFWVLSAFSEQELSVTIKDDTSCLILYLCSTLCNLSWGPDRSPPRMLSFLLTCSPGEHVSERWQVLRGYLGLQISA